MKRESGESLAENLALITGAGLAAYMSWCKWHSIFWAVTHGILCGWVYVIYSVIRYGVPK